MATGEIKLFGYWRSQATYRVRIALALKGLEWEETPVDVLSNAQYAGEIAQHNPQHAVPVLIDNGRPLTQSLAIIEYLEERYPRPHLLPEDPYMRAQVRSFALISVADSHPFQVPRVGTYLATQLSASEADIKSWAQYWQTQALQAMEARLAQRQHATPYCFSDTPALADICLAAQVSSAMLLDTPTETYTAVHAVYTRCLKLDAFAAHSPQALKPDG